MANDESRRRASTEARATWPVGVPSLHTALPGDPHVFKAKKPTPELNPIVLEAMRPVIDVALTLGPRVREHIAYRHRRDGVMTAVDVGQATRLERAEAERLADHVAQQSPDVVRAAFALSAAARYLAGTADVLHEQHASRLR